MLLLVMMPTFPTRLKQKTIAIASGKGGVGKSTTAVNLAVYYTRMGMRVALLDIDPLSDLAVILDLNESALAQVRERLDLDGNRLADYLLPVCPGLDLVFPRAKLVHGDPVRLLGALLGRFAAQLDEHYDLIIMDLPAGIQHDENLAFLPLASFIVVVTVSEPTAHVSAGGFVKASLEINPRARFLFWHNKFKQTPDSGFNPRQIIENYNRHAPEDLALQPEKIRFWKDIAFVPHDPALDLLQRFSSVEAAADLKMLETLDTLSRLCLGLLPFPPQLDENLRNLILFYLSSRPVPASATELEDYCLTFYRESGSQTLGKYLARKKERLFTDAALADLDSFLDRLRADRLYNAARKAHTAVARALSDLEERRKLFAAARTAALALQAQKEVATVIRLGAAVVLRPATPSLLKNLAGLLLFQLSLTRLAGSQRTRQSIGAFIPVRKDAKGKLQRDKNRQIRYLIHKDEGYHRKYFALIKTIFPDALAQLQSLASGIGTQSLLFRAAGGTLNKGAYLKLLTEFIHDAVHAGLGVFIGFRFNPASEAIRKGAQAILDLLKPPATERQNPSEVQIRSRERSAATTASGGSGLEKK